ncbi:MAG: ankyrin repeat domain-containing protein [Puniceicoccales bacterium]|nr:ankyrin repeat domain-containing protein [Puniceicoccales bacterium]
MAEKIPATENASPPEAKILELSKSKEEIRNAQDRCIYILKNLKCQENSEEYQKLESLLKQYPDLIHGTDNEGRTLLIHAVLFRREDVIVFLLKRNCPLDIQDCEGNTALSHAVQKGYLEAVVLLLYGGANPNIYNKKGFKAYDLACDLIDQNIASVILYFHPSSRLDKEK